MRGMKMWMGAVFCVCLATQASAKLGDRRLISTVRVSYQNGLSTGPITVITQDKNGSETKKEIKSLENFYNIKDVLKKDRPHLIQLPNGAEIKVYTNAERCGALIDSALWMHTVMTKVPDPAKADDKMISSSPGDWSKKWCVGGLVNLGRKITVVVGQGGISFSDKIF